MAYLTEDQVWEEGIYQWETDDPVVGGPTGLDNLPTKQLANRTKYLKARADAHDSAADPHPQYLTQAEGAAAFDQISAAANAINGHTTGADPHPSYFNQTRGDARYARGDHAHNGTYEPAGNVAAHANAADPHGQYLTQQRGDARYAQIGADGGMANHVASADPHPQYQTLAETEAAYSKLGHNHAGVYEPAGATATHTNAADPHTQYQTQARSDARYSQLGHGHAGLYDPAGSGQAARDWAYNWAAATFAQPGWVSATFVARNAGTDWFAVGDHLIQRGTVHVGDVGSGNYAWEVYIGFPVAFPSAPTVTVTRAGDSTGGVPGIRNVNQYGFSLYVEEWGNNVQDAYVNWIAVY